MKAKTAIEHQLAMDIPCLMLPMGQHQMLAPTVSIAEIVSYQTPVPVLDSPDWLVGIVEWRKQKLPLLSLEVLRGEARSDITAKSRVAVFNNTGVSDDLPFFAVVTQGIPRLTRVLEATISEVQDQRPLPFERLRVHVEGEVCSIPDVGAMEQLLLDYRRNGGDI